MTTERAYVKHGSSLLFPKPGWSVLLCNRTESGWEWECFWYPTFELAVAGLPSIWRKQ